MNRRSLFLRSCLLALALASYPARAAKPTFNGTVSASKNLEGRIDVSWTALYNATSVTIWRSGSEYLSEATPVATVSVSGAGTWTEGTWPDTTAVVKSAAYFTEFHYWIQASNADGSTLESGKHDKGYRNPGSPGNPVITVHPGASPTGVDLSWTRADFAVTYEIYRSATEAALSNGTATKIGTVSGTSSNLTFTDSGTAPGVEYWYAVDARNPAGVGRGNHGLSYRAVSVSHSPNHLENLAASAQTKTVTVTANTAWTVEKSSGATWLTLGATSGSGNGSFTVSVTRNTTGARRSAFVTIRAGTGTAHPLTATIPVDQICIVPSAPTGVTASDGTSEAFVRVSWNASEGAGTYDVYRANSASGQKAVIGSTSSTSLDDTSFSLMPGITYYYWVVAKSSAGNSSFSSCDTGWKKIGIIAPFSVFRFYSKAYKGHFFTIDEEEKNTIENTNPNWKYEGVAYRAFKVQASGTTALHRFYSKNYRGHFFTIDAEEAETVKTNPNWKYEGVAYYVFNSPDEMMGTVPVHRFWSKAYRHHFYTTDEAEKDDLIANNPNWKYEGVAFHALPVSGAKAKAAVASAADGSLGKPALPKEGFPEAAWTLSAKDGAVVAVPGTTEIGGVVVETRADAPDTGELEAGGAGVSPAGEIALRLALPGGASDATLWSAAEGPLAGEVAEGALDFALPATGVWHWLRVRDAADGEVDDAFSVWLRAE